MSLNFSHFFDSIAHHYEAKIIPAFGPLAADLIEWAAPIPTNHVLDSGAGTGIVARLVAPKVDSVIATDIAPRMVQVAAQSAHHLRNVYVVQADSHALPFHDNYFDLVLSSFGLNATHPRRTLKEIWRVLKPNGRLVLQEWGRLHPFDHIIVEALEVYMVDDEDAPANLVALRDFLAEDRAWYEMMQTELDYSDELSAIGFNRLLVAENCPVRVQLSLQDFLAYKLAWPSRIAELEAMDESARGDCLDMMRKLLQPNVGQDGLLGYDPFLFRVQASKPR